MQDQIDNFILALAAIPEDHARLITPKSNAIIAITNNTCIILPPVGYTKNPNTQPITRITAIM